jgi:hypothetical protein
MAFRDASIARSLEAIGPKLRGRLAWTGTAEVLIALSAFVLVSLPLDWMLELPLVARIVILAGAGSAAAIVAIRARRRLLQRFEEADMAAAVEGADPTLDGHLANVLELPDEARTFGADGGGEHGSAFESVLEQKLLERAMAESSERASRASIVGALSPVPLLQRAGLAAMGIAIVALCATGAPSVFSLWFRRDILLSGETWPRKTHLVLDRKETVWHHARKDPLEIGAWVTGEIPRQVKLGLAAEGSHRDVLLVPGVFGKVALPPTATSDADGESASEVEGRRLLHTIPSVTESFDFSLEGGDNHSDTVKVLVHDRPRILVARLALKFPAYLALEAKTLENPGGDIAVPAGTEIAVEAVADQDLSAAWLRFGAGEKITAAVAEKTARGSLVPAENGFLDVGITEAVWGLSSEPPLRFAIVVLPDKPPAVALEVVGESRSVTARGKVGYKVVAEDDHGFSDVSLKTWVRALGDSRSDEEIEPIIARFTGSPQKIDAGVRSTSEGEIDLAPLNLATGSSITLQAFTSDNDGVAGPKSASSQRETIVVIDAEELRKELDKVRVEAQAALEQLAAREEQVAKTVAQVAAARKEPRTASEPQAPDEPAAKEEHAASESPASESASAKSAASKSAGSKSKSAKSAPAKSTASKSAASKSASPSEDPSANEPADASANESASSQESASSKSASSKSAASKKTASSKSSPSRASNPAKAGEKQAEEPSTTADAHPDERKEEPSAAEQLAKEQEAIAQDAAAVSRKLREMTRTLQQNKLIEPAEERRLRDEVSKPLDEVTQERLPESASEIGALPEAERPAEQAAAAQRKAEKISDDVKNVAEKLAGSGNFREILQRLELIIQLQQRTIGETEKRVPEESAPAKPGDANGGKERSF